MAMKRYVSRGALKLIEALDHFQIDVSRCVAADLGSCTGGFVEVLIERGIQTVYAVEKGYGVLDWSLRNNRSVVVLERTDGRFVALPELVDIVTIDIGFTRQSEVLPHAIGLAKPGGMVLSLLKPQYEALKGEYAKGRVTPSAVDGIVRRVTDELQTSGTSVSATFAPTTRGKDAGIQEVFLLVRLGKNYP